MSSVLIVRPSSLGDIVHALPVVQDIKQHRAETSVDWVAEEMFADLVRLNRNVRSGDPGFVATVATRAVRTRYLARDRRLPRRAESGALRRRDRLAGTVQRSGDRPHGARRNARCRPLPDARAHGRACIPARASHRAAPASDRSLPPARGRRHSATSRSARRSSACPRRRPASRRPQSRPALSWFSSIRPVRKRSFGRKRTGERCCDISRRRA